MLATILHQWKRAREARTSGELQRAKALYQAALEHLGNAKPLRKELQDIERAINARNHLLSEIERALEVGDFQETARLIDTATEERVAPTWLATLRREVRSCLDAGTTALNEAARLLADGKTRAARLSLISLLSRRETRDQALTIWKEIDTREAAAGDLLGHAEALALGPSNDTKSLVQALQSVEDATNRQTDHPGTTDLRTLILNKTTANEKLEQARVLMGSGQLELALRCCQEGERADPTNPMLKTLGQRIRYKRVIEVMKEAEILMAQGQHEDARRLLSVAHGYPAMDPESFHQIQHLLARCEIEAPELDGHAGSTACETRHSTVPPDRADHDSPLPARFMIHVEEGPEALVLTDEVIRIGNARNTTNHIALMANVSSCHATLHREISFHGGVTYRLRVEDGKECRVHSFPVRDRSLQDADEIEIGREVVLRFRLPDPGSSTALIQITRGYHVDDIKNIILLKGPGRDGRIRIAPAHSSHLVCPGSDRNVDLCLGDSPGSASPSLQVEAPGSLEVDGIQHQDRAPISLGSYVRCGTCRLQIGRAP